MEYLIYLILGSVAGLVSGLFGVGGGTVIVPILLLSFAAQGISPSIATHTAIATSLACIAVSSLTAIYTHLKKGVIDWRVVRSFIPGIIIGTLVGSSFFVSIDGEILQILLGVFLLAIGIQMITYRATKMDVKLPRRIYLGLSGISIGGISALFGVGGGMFTTPLLSYYGIKIHSAISVGHRWFLHCPHRVNHLRLDDSTVVCCALVYVGLYLSSGMGGYYHHQYTFRKNWCRISASIQRPAVKENIWYFLVAAGIEVYLG